MESDRPPNLDFFENETLTACLYSLNLLDNKGTPRNLMPELGIGGNTEPNYVLNVISDPVIRAGTLLASGAFADVTFLVGPEKIEISGHKFMLAAASEVFNTMFYGSIPEGDVVVIPFGNAEAFCLMLQYIYMGVVPVTIKADLGLELFDLARKYWLKSYEEHIAMALAKSISAENVLIVLGASILYDMSLLESACWKYIDINVMKVLRTESFTEIDSSTLCKLLQRDGLEISELDLFYFVIKWGVAEMDRRDQLPLPDVFRSALRPCLKHIRFPTMTATEFANGPGRTCVLSNEESGEILLYICSTDAIKPPCRWPTKPRPYNVPEEETEINPELVCDCTTVNPICSFCFGRGDTESQADRRHYANMPSTYRAAPPPVRGRSGAVVRRRPLTAVPTPAPYCRCRTRGNCPENSLEYKPEHERRPVTVPVGPAFVQARRGAGAYRPRATLQAEQTIRMEQDRILLRRDLLDRQIQRNSRTLPG